jgi:hypothetical protein
MFFTPLALLVCLGNALALITAYRLRQWDRPVIAGSGTANRFADPDMTTERR